MTEQPINPHVKDISGTDYAVLYLWSVFYVVIFGLAFTLLGGVFSLGSQLLLPVVPIAGTILSLVLPIIIGLVASYLTVKITWAASLKYPVGSKKPARTEKRGVLTTVIFIISVLLVAFFLVFPIVMAVYGGAFVGAIHLFTKTFHRESAIVELNSLVPLMEPLKAMASYFLYRALFCVLFVQLLFIMLFKNPRLEIYSSGLLRNVPFWLEEKPSHQK
jgi:hypothetical protein